MAALGDDATITFREGGTRSICWRAGGDELDLADVHTVWYRRTSDPRRAAAVRDSDEARFVVNEWRELFISALLTMGCRFVNPPGRQAEAVKPYQLRLAREAGLSIPETLIT